MSEPKQYSAKTGCFIIALICISMAALSFWALSAIWPAKDCSETSEAVAFARSLPSERLEQLYDDMERISKDDSFPLEKLYIWNLEKGETFPEPFSDIQATQIRPREENIMLEGCFDSYVYLLFDGFGSSIDSEKKITLQWEVHGSEPYATEAQVLWHKNGFEPGELVNASSPDGMSENHLHD